MSSPLTSLWTIVIILESTREDEALESYVFGFTKLILLLAEIVGYSGILNLGPLFRVLEI